MFLAPKFFCCARPKILDQHYKIFLVLTIVQNFTPVGPRILEISRVEKKLEIWGTAQRESARRPKSGWGKLRGGEVLRGAENFPGIKVTWPKLKCIGIHQTRFVDLG